MKIAIAGFGAEGKATLAYYEARGGYDVTILDERPIEDAPEGVPVISGPHAFENLNKYDMVIRTAGLAPHKLGNPRKVWSGTNEFFAKCPAPIIGVTGTKGKGTTSTMIADILRAAGKTVWLVGNIGKPALEVLTQIKPEDIVVFELSSFQLWDIEKSPHVAVVLLIEPDHLNVHETMDDYIEAKRHIVSHQTSEDFCIINMNNPISAGFATNAKSTVIGYAQPGPHSVYCQDNFFVWGNARLFPTSILQVIGQHNKENACAAIAVAKALEITNESIREGLEGFEGLPHRLEFIRDYKGVKYYNDSFSSAPSATIAAIRSFDQPTILILGGVEKGGDYSQLAHEIAASTSIKSVLLIGQFRNGLEKILQDAGVNSSILTVDATTMPEIVRIASSDAKKGDVVLLSPGCASFDMFENFYDRGDQFRKNVQELS